MFWYVLCYAGFVAAKDSSSTLSSFENAPGKAAELAGSCSKLDTVAAKGMSLCIQFVATCWFSSV